MSKNDFRLPETAIRSNDCFNSDFMFHREAEKIARKIEEVLDSFEEKTSKEHALYPNNVIGILGGRGTGKTSLMASLSSTLLARPESVPFKNKEGIRVHPLFNDIIDPKVLPDCIGIVDLTVSALLNDFKEWTLRIGGDESAALDERIDGIYDDFEKLGKDIQTFYAKEREDAIGDPSDLYEISGLTKIRSELEKLISNLLKIKNGPHPVSRSAFLLLIDDFDLDFSNCYQMAFDIVSLLNVNGLVILMAMDEETFKLEFTREMIKRQSDFGPASSILLEQSIRRAGSAPIPGARRYSVETILENQERYFDQVYNKMIPMDFRFPTRGHDLNEVGGEAFRNRFSAFCEWLFGIKPSWRTKKKDGTFVERFYDIFFNALSEKKDLRTRNQGINRILTLWADKVSGTDSEREFLEGLSEVFESFRQATSGAIRSFWERILDSIDSFYLPERQKISRYIEEHHASVLDTDDGGEISVYEIGEGVFSTRPASYAVYETMVGFLSSDPSAWSTLLQDYRDILIHFTDKNLEVSVVEENAKTGLLPCEILKIGDICKLDIESLSNSLFEDRRGMLVKQIEDTIRLYTKMTKTDVRVLVASIETYLAKRRLDSDVMAPFIEEIKDALKEKWAGKDNEKDNSIRRISSALRMIRRRL